MPHLWALWVWGGEMRQNLVIYPLGFRLTDPVAGAHYPLADGPGARRSAVRTIMASLLDVVSRAGFTAQGNSKMYRPAGLALLIGVYIVVPTGISVLSRLLYFL